MMSDEHGRLGAPRPRMVAGATSAVVLLWLLLVAACAESAREGVLARGSGPTADDGGGPSVIGWATPQPAEDAAPNPTSGAEPTATAGGDAHGRAIADAAVVTRHRLADDGATDQAGMSSVPSASEAEETVTVLLVGRSAEVSGCGAGFASAGEQLVLGASGFEAHSSVSFTARWASFAGGDSHELTIPAQTADEGGKVSFSWSVPAAPDVSVDAAPRGYAIQMRGSNPQGGIHTASMLDLLVVYPGVALCAVGDSVSTALGAAVDVAVLANDVVPSGGSLDKSTVVVRGAAGGVFSVDAGTGVVSFVPDEGFWGTVETAYVVYDGWGIGVEAELAVTVDAGCTITGTVGVARIVGTEGGDVICVPDRDDRRAFHVIDARGGDDVVLGGAGVEWIYGGAGADVIYGNGGDDRIVAGAGADTVYGGAGMDSVYSDDLADRIVDDDYETVLSALAPAQSAPEPEADWVWAGVSQTVQVDVLENDHDPNEDLDPFTLRVTKAPESGAATIARDSGGGPVVEFSAPSSGGFVSFSYEVCDSLGRCASAGVTVMVGTAECTIVGTARRDRLVGTSGDDVICGLGGRDVIRGLGGDDVIVGGGGDDTIRGGDGADVLWGGSGADDLYGEGGADRLWGGPGADSVQGGMGADRLFGGAGPDALTGGDGADRLWGGPSADVLIANRGDDVLWGGPGSDTLYGGNDDDTIWGGFGDDTVRGGDGDDTIWAGPGDDTVDGLNGSDTIWGGVGNDVLRGDSGADMLWGGPGDDTLDGSKGTDHLDGGPGADTCLNADTHTECQ